MPRPRDQFPFIRKKLLEVLADAQAFQACVRCLANALPDDV